MQADTIQGMQPTAEKLIFNAAFDGGSEKLYEVCANARSIVSYILRRNTFINDDGDNELWNEGQRNFESVPAYLETVSKRLATYTPIELDERFSELFKDHLLQSVRASGIEGERKMFNLGNGFCSWARWLKVFGGGNSIVQEHQITIHNFNEKEPIRRMQIDTRAIMSFQSLLNYIFAAMLPTAFQTGQYGKGWILFNLKTSIIVENVSRRSLPVFAAGDEFAVLRLVGNGGSLTQNRG